VAFNRSIRFPDYREAPQHVLTRKVSTHFTSTLRNRGLDYFMQGRVVITRGTAFLVEARVRGHRPYNVDLLFEDGVLKVNCTCEYFESSGPCKHIWATLLAADEQTFLSDAANARGPIHLDDGSPAE
jgi:uncharacterized Zn finger protein